MRSVGIDRLKELIKEAQDNGRDTAKLKALLSKLLSKEPPKPSRLVRSAPKGREELFAVGGSPKDEDFEGVAIREIE